MPASHFCTHKQPLHVSTQSLCSQFFSSHSYSAHILTHSADMSPSTSCIHICQGFRHRTAFCSTSLDQENGNLAISKQKARKRWWSCMFCKSSLVASCSDTCFWASLFSGLCIQNKFSVCSVFYRNSKRQAISKDQKNCLLLLPLFLF